MILTYVFRVSFQSSNSSELPNCSNYSSRSPSAQYQSGFTGNHPAFIMHSPSSLYLQSLHRISSTICLKPTPTLAPSARINGSSLQIHSFMLHLLTYFVIYSRIPEPHHSPKLFFRYKTFIAPVTAQCFTHVFSFLVAFSRLPVHTFFQRHLVYMDKILP